MFNKLQEINKRPEPFEFYTAADLWTDEHTSKKMLEYHLNESIDVSSRNINFINRSVDWLTERFKLNEDSNVIDFGCGPGLYTTRFARKGINVTGVDFSKRSIEYARQVAAGEKLDVEYIHANYLEFTPAKKYDLITMIMCDFCALSPVQRRAILDKFRGMLKPQGHIVLDVYSLNYFNQREEAALYELNQLYNFWSADDYYSFQNTFKYGAEKVVLDKYTIIEQSGTRVVYNWLQYFSVDSLKKELEASGLRVVGVFSDVAGTEYKDDSLEIAVDVEVG